MLKFKTTASLILAFGILVSQVGSALASPITQEEFITGTVTGLVCETDTTTGITTFVVTVEDEGGSSQTVRIDQLTAEKLGLATIDGDGNVDCSKEALQAVIGTEVEIDPADVIPDEQEPQHPVGSALSTFFSEIIDYDTVMMAHDGGFDFGPTGFGVIAQALWLTKRLEGDSDVFLAILRAKGTGDYSEFGFDEDVAPKNWGQFRKAILDGEGSLGTVMSDNNNGNGFGNGIGNGNGNGNNNANNNKDKGDKGKGDENGKGRDR